MTSLPAAIDLRAEGRLDPIGLDEPRPRLSWRLDLASWGRHFVEVAR
jgi:hypothetical protein